MHILALLRPSSGGASKDLLTVFHLLTGWRYKIPFMHVKMVVVDNFMLRSRFAHCVLFINKATDFVFSFHAFAEVPRHSRWRWPGSLNLFPMHAQKCRYSRWPRSVGLTLSHACAEMPQLNMAVTSWDLFFLRMRRSAAPQDGGDQPGCGGAWGFTLCHGGSHSGGWRWHWAGPKVSLTNFWTKSLNEDFGVLPKRVVNIHCSFQMLRAIKT